MHGLKDHYPAPVVGKRSDPRVSEGRHLQELQIRIFHPDCALISEINAWVVENARDFPGVSIFVENVCAGTGLRSFRRSSSLCTESQYFDSCTSCKHESQSR
jgi:hypothetical protein